MQDVMTLRKTNHHLWRGFAIFVSFFFASDWAWARAEDEAQRVVAEMLREGRNVPNLRGIEKIEAVREITRRFVHVDGVADYSLATYRRAIAQEPEMHREYREVFANFLAHWLAARLTRDFALADFQAVDPYWEGGENNAVRVQLRPRNGNVNGSIRVIDLGNRNYKIYDLTFESVSLLVTYRREFTGFLAGRSRADGRPDFAGLIARIRSQTAELQNQIMQQR